MKYLDALALAQIRNLRLPLRRLSAEGTLGGLHRSAHKGFSQEFAEHREYVPGDELKFLDWKVYARKDRYYVREFVEEKSLRSYLLLDCSGSMTYRERGLISKFDYAASWAMALAYLVLKQKDHVGLVTFDSRLRAVVPPSDQMGHLHVLDEALAKSAPSAAADFPRAARRLAGLLSRRSLLMVFTDLLGDPAGFRDALRAFRAQKHEVLVFQVLDPAERELPWEGQVRVEGLEGGDPLPLDAGLLREAYRESFEHELRLNEAAFRESEIGYHVLDTSKPTIQTLSRFLTHLAQVY